MFLWRLLVSPQQRRAVQSTASGAAGSMPNISKSNLSKVRIPCPPISIQNRFATIVEKVEDTKVMLQESLDSFETMFAAFSDKAFKGQLDLSRVVVSNLDTEHVQESIGLEASDDVSSFELPSPAKGKKFKGPKSRKTALKNWLSAYSMHLGDEPVEADSFIALVQQKLSDLESDSDIEWYSHEIGIEEYDEMKKWIFEELKSNRLSQNYDDETNRVRVSGAKE